MTDGPSLVRDVGFYQLPQLFVDAGGVRIVSIQSTGLEEYSLCTEFTFMNSQSASIPIVIGGDSCNDKVFTREWLSGG